VAIVTGGSSGLGRSIATAFASAGASVVLSARGQELLDSATAGLTARGFRASGIVADVTRQESIDALVARTLTEHGRIDVLVNNAGRSARRAIADTTPEDFRQLLELNLLGLVRTTRAALPHLLASRGHVVNIGSLAGKIAARFLGAYPASKFAVAAYSQQLRLELEPQGLHVLLVSPGPIARDAPRHRGQGDDPIDDAAGLPASARKPGGGVKTSMIDPEWLAGAIVRACERRRRELVVPRTARLVAAIGQLSPALGDWIVRKLTG
jgi:short-subunit dehydrogenase